MTVPQLLIVMEEQERMRLENMIDQSDAVAFGASTLFDGKQSREWKRKIIKLLDK